MSEEKKLSLSEEDRKWFKRQFRAPFWLKVSNFVVVLVLTGLLLCVFFFPSFVFSGLVGFFAFESGDYYSDRSLVEVVGENIDRSCRGDFDCVVRDALFFSSWGVVYEWADAVSFVKSSELTVVEGGNCKDKALVFCGLVLFSGFRCQAVGVSEVNHAFSRVWGGSGEEFCFDATGGVEVDCSVLDSGLVFFDSREWRK